jgi:hypothetical protein
MPISYRYFSCDNVPELDVGDSITHEAQASIAPFNHDPHSSLRYLGIAAQSDFRRYECTHQDVRNVDGIVNQQEVRSMIFNERFGAYYNAERSYFVVQADKRRSLAYFDRLERADPPIVAKPAKLDLARVVELGHTTGGWFSNVKLSGVKTAGLFGSEDIVDSVEWERYSAEANMSALYLRIESRAGAIKTVMVTKDRVILVMKDEGERDNLDFVAQLNDAFVEMGCVLDAD